MNSGVIGGGPAGLSAGIGLVRAGFQTIVYEQKKEWTGRVCGAFLSPEALRHLDWLGVLDRATEEGVPVQAAVLFDSNGRSFEMPIHQQGRPALALSRKSLEDILSEQARKEGVKIISGTRAQYMRGKENSHFLKIRSGQGNESDLRFDLAVSAEGRFPAFRSVPKLKPKLRWYGVNADFEGTRQRPGEISLHFFDGGYVGLLTYKNGWTNVCGLIRENLKVESGKSWETVVGKLIEKSPSLNQRLSGGTPVSNWRGVGPLPFGRYLEVSKGPWLAGDAAAVCDPFMGEGIARALHAGPMIFDSFKEAEKILRPIGTAFHQYRKNWNESYRMRENMGSVLRLCCGNPAALGVLFGLLSKSKALQAFILSRIHQS